MVRQGKLPHYFWKQIYYTPTISHAIYATFIEHQKLFRFGLGDEFADS